MTQRAYDPEVAHIVPLLPVESDWSDLDAARAQMAEMVANIPPSQSIGASRYALWRKKANLVSYTLRMMAIRSVNQTLELCLTLAKVTKIQNR